jgi:hypothetical protein
MYLYAFQYVCALIRFISKCLKHLIIVNEESNILVIGLMPYAMRFELSLQRATYGFSETEQEETIKLTKNITP